jgi:rhodanese-related sulfurtransferase
MMGTLWRAVLIVVVGFGLGLGVNALRSDDNSAGQPRRLPLVTPPKVALAASDIISLSEAERLWNEGAAMFLDARSPADYEAGHIALAHHLPLEDFSQRYGDLEPLLTREAPLIVYCDGVECDLSHKLMNQLRQLGYQHVRVLVNGWTEWRKAGLPTARGKPQ